MLTDPTPGALRQPWPGGSFLFAVWLALTVVTALPLVVGNLTETEGQQFMGFADKVPDAATYVARMRLGHDGAWLYRNPYTAEYSQPTLTNIFFLFLGHVCRWVHLPLTVGFHVFRVLFGAVMLWGVAWLAAVCLPSRRVTQAAVLLFAFSSGVGFWLSLFVPQRQPTMSLDLWVPEAFGFYAFMVNPLFCLGTGLTALVLGQAYLAVRDDDAGRSTAVLGLSFLVCVIHPYEGLILNALVPAVCLCSRRLASKAAAVRTWLAMVGGTVPAMAYYYLAYHASPGMEGALRANVTRTPSPLWVFAGYGALWVLAAGGAWWSRRARHDVPLFVLVWPVVQVLLIYTPVVQFQRKLIQGAQIPLCLLASLALVWLCDWTARGDAPLVRLGRRTALGGLVVLLGATSAFVVARQCARVASGHRLFRLTADEVAALEWLGRHSKGEGVTFTSPHVGLFTPVVAGNPVVVGHWAETPSFEQREQDSDRFFSARTGHTERAKLLSTFGAKYVVVGSEDRGEGAFSAGESPLLRLLFSRPGAQVYAVVDTTLTD